MLILIVEGLTWTCTINGILIQLCLLFKKNRALFHFADNALIFFSQRHHPVSSFSSPLPLSHHSQVKVLDGEDEYYKLLSAVESIPEEEYPTTTPSRPL